MPNIKLTINVPIFPKSYIKYPIAVSQNILIPGIPAFIVILVNCCVTKL